MAILKKPLPRLRTRARLILKWSPKVVLSQPEIALGCSSKWPATSGFFRNVAPPVCNAIATSSQKVSFYGRPLGYTQCPSRCALYYASQAYILSIFWIFNLNSLSTYLLLVFHPIFVRQFFFYLFRSFRSSFMNSVSSAPLILLSVPFVRQCCSSQSGRSSSLPHEVQVAFCRFQHGDACKPA